MFILFSRKVLVSVIVLCILSFSTVFSQDGVHLGGTFVEKDNFFVFILMGNSAMSGRDPARDTVEHPKAWNYVIPNPDRGDQPAYVQENQYTWVPAKSPLHYDVRSSGNGGPGFPFIKKLAQRYPGASFGVLQLSSSAWTANQRFQRGSVEYNLLIGEAYKLMDSVTIAGLVSMFGLVEVQFGGSNVENYLQDISTTVEHVRSDLGIDNLPYIHSCYPQEAQGDYSPETQNAQTLIANEIQIPDSISYSFLVPTESLTVYDDGFLSHYDSSGCAGWAGRVVDSIGAHTDWFGFIESGFVFSPSSVEIGCASSNITGGEIISITNSAPDLGTLENVSASVDIDWLDYSFSDNEGNEQELVVSLNSNAESLGEGTYIGSITFTADNVDTRMLSVELEISQYGPNLALGKTTEASTGAESASNAVDGNADTRWESDFEDNQWISVDLEETCQINRVVISWQNAASEVYAVQISDDGSSWTTIDSVSDGESGETRELDVSGEGRYIRIYGYTRTTGYGHSIYELEVYGTKATKATRKGFIKKPSEVMKIRNSEIFFVLEKTQEIRVELFALSGRRAGVLFEGTAPAGNMVCRIPADFTGGLYIVKFEKEGSQVFEKALKLY